MRLDRLTEAELEARRFLTRVKELRKRIEVEVGQGYGISNSHDRNLVDGCKETASVKRASMDLSRAVSKLRKGDYEK